MILGSFMFEICKIYVLCDFIMLILCIEDYIVLKKLCVDEFIKEMLNCLWKWFICFLIFI